MTNRPAQHERLLIDRFRGDNRPASTVDPREAQREFDQETTMGKDVVTVTQADREAFARLEGFDPGEMGWRMIVEPSNGDCVGAVAFARHREQAERATEARFASSGGNVVGEGLAADAVGAVSEEAIACLAIRSQINRAIYRAVRGYVMSNMCQADDHSCPFPLVDLMSNEPPADIATGEMEMISLVDEIEASILAHRHPEAGESA